MVRNDSDARILLCCVNLSVARSGRLSITEGDAAPLKASSSEIRQRFESVVGPGKARAFWRDWTANFIDPSDFQRLKRQGSQRRASTVKCQVLTKRSWPGKCGTDQGAGSAIADQSSIWRQRGARRVDGCARSWSPLFCLPLTWWRGSETLWDTSGLFTELSWRACHEPPRPPD